MTEILDAMTPPDVNGQPSLPKRAAPKGLLPRHHGARTDPKRRRRQNVDFMGSARAL